jgi:hypothetical protein
LPEGIQDFIKLPSKTSDMPDKMEGVYEPSTTGEIVDLPSITVPADIRVNVPPLVKKVPTKVQPIKNTAKWRRNWKCYCGSGRKYKFCCWKKDQKARQEEARADGEYKD